MGKKSDICPSRRQNYRKLCNFWNIMLNFVADKHYNYT